MRRQSVEAWPCGTRRERFEPRLRGVLKSAVRAASVALAVGAVTACAAGLIAQRGRSRLTRVRTFAARPRSCARRPDLTRSCCWCPATSAPVFAYYYGSQGWMALPDDPVLDIRNLLSYDRDSATTQPDVDRQARGLVVVVAGSRVLTRRASCRPLLDSPGGWRRFRHAGLPWIAPVALHLPAIRGGAGAIAPGDVGRIEDAGPQRGVERDGLPAVWPGLRRKGIDRDCLPVAVAAAASAEYPSI